MIPDFEKWQAELLVTGQIIPLDDNGVPHEEKVRRLARYNELLEMAEGFEGQAAVESLFNSAQAQPEKDYEAYNTLLTVINRFPKEILAKGYVRTISAFIDRDKDSAGDFMRELAEAFDTTGKPYSDYFNDDLAELEPESRAKIIKFIRLWEEPQRWLSKHVNEFAPVINYRPITSAERTALREMFYELLAAHGLTNTGNLPFTINFSQINESLAAAESVNNTELVAFWKEYLSLLESL